MKLWKTATQEHTRTLFHCSLLKASARFKLLLQLLARRAGGAPLLARCKKAGKSGWPWLCDTVPYQRLVYCWGLFCFCFLFFVFFFHQSRHFLTSLHREPGYKDHLLDSRARWTSRLKLSDDIRGHVHIYVHVRKYFPSHLVISSFTRVYGE